MLQWLFWDYRRAIMIRFKKNDGSNYPDLERHTLKEYLKFKNGLNAPKEKFGTGIKYISVLDILNNISITYDAIRGMVDIDEDTLKEFSVEYGDVLFQRSSETKIDAGKANVYLDKDNTATFGGFIIRGKKIGEYNPIYMNYLLKSEKVRKQIIRKAQGEQHVNVGQEMLETISIAIPCMSEQQKIADFLSAIDDIITSSQKEVINLEEQKKGVIQKIFSHEVRFKVDDGSQYPDWEEVCLSEVLSEYKETCSKDGTYEHVSLTKQGVVPKTEQYERDFLVTSDDKKYRITHYNDICYNPANLKFGVICRNRYKDAIFSPIYVTFKINNGYIPEFVETMVTRADFINYALKYQQGTVYERMAVSSEDLLKIHVLVPCIEEQQKITDLLSDFDTAIDLAKQELEQWKELKKGLLQQLFE